MLFPSTVRLTCEEQVTLDAMIHRGKANARTVTRARILLKSADGWSTAAIAEALDVCQATVTNVRRRFAQGGLGAVLPDKVQQHRRSALSGLQTAHLIAVACSPAPDGHDHWTVRLLADKAVELGFVETISLDTVQRLLKKMNGKPWQQEHWCLPKVGGEFVAAMEDVLDVYEQAYDPAHPAVCFDEKSVALHADVRPTLPAAPGVPERIDYEYERKGTANLFFLVEPLRCWRQVTVTAQRTKQEYAEQMRWLVDVAYPEAEYVRVVQDNLNTHTPGALYEAFAPEEARRILRRLQFHYTPKHASWLNMAEIEIGIFQRSCLRRRLGDEQQLSQQVTALQAERNAKHCTISWQFTAGDARVKLQRLYPKS